MTTHNFFKTYSIGSTFPNENGEIYTVIGMNEVDDKALLYRKTEKDTDFYVGARFPRLNSWGQGHYFMEDYKSAMKWLIGEDNIEEKIKAKEITVKEYTDLFIDKDTVIFFADDAVNPDGNYKCYPEIGEIPEEFLESIVQRVHLDIYFGEHAMCSVWVIIHVDSTVNPKTKDFFDYGVTSDNSII